MSTHDENIATLGWDPEDPHGILGEHDHGHPVVGWKTQLGVLLLLLFFTFTTVLFYNAEKWIEVAFEIYLPWWVNVVGAMSIATVKAVLVCMFFMQLRYDKALNTFAMLFCLFCVALFLTFSMIDLETRDRVVAWKQGEAQYGGTGVGLDAPAIDEDFSMRFSPRVNTGGASLLEFRRQEQIDAKIAQGKTEADFWAYHYSHHPEARHPADEGNYFSQLGYDHGDELPDADESFPRHGLTAGLFDAVDPRANDDDGHGGGHGGDDGH